MSSRKNAIPLRKLSSFLLSAHPAMSESIDERHLTL